jgi:hypothetical protein
VLKAKYAQKAKYLINAANVIAKKRYNDKHTLIEFKKKETVYFRLYKGYYLLNKLKKK